MDDFTLFKIGEEYMPLRPLTCLKNRTLTFILHSTRAEVIFQIIALQPETA